MWLYGVENKNRNLTAEFNELNIPSPLNAVKTAVRIF